MSAEEARPTDQGRQLDDQDFANDDVAQVMMAAEGEQNDENDDVVYDAEPAVITQFRKSLIEAYSLTSAASRAISDTSYSWLLSLFRKAPRANTNWQEQHRPGHPQAPWITSSPNRITSLLPPATEAHSVQGREVHGLEMLLAVALDLNEEFREPVQAAITRNQPLPGRIIEKLSLGPARHSLDAGVYALQASSGHFIIGHAVSMGFRGRLNKPDYSSSRAVVDILGSGQNGEDQRHGRQDYILFSLDNVPMVQRSLRHFATGLESLTILMFQSFEAEYGMNTNLSDSRWQLGSVTPHELLKFWEIMLEVTNAGVQIPPVKGSEYTKFVRFEDFYLTHLRGREGIPPLTIERTCRLIAIMSALADTRSYPSFPPLSQDAFMWRRTIERGVERTIYSYDHVTGGAPREYHGGSTNLRLADIVLRDEIDLMSTAIAWVLANPDFQLSFHTRMAREVNSRRKQLAVVDAVGDVESHDDNENQNLGGDDDDYIGYGVGNGEDEDDFDGLYD